MIPFLAREVVYRLQESMMRRPTFAYLSEIEQSQWLSRAQMEALQSRKLASLLRIALQHSPWHAERIRTAGLAQSLGEPDSPLEWSAFRRLPLMDKSDAAAHRDRIAWQGVPGGAHLYTTGGSSGAPLIFYYGRRRQASDAAARMRARRWWGVEFGEPEVFLWGSPVELSKTDRIKSLRDRLLNQLVLSAFNMSPASMDEYADAIRRFNPACIYGYASSVALLASHVLSKGGRLRVPRLKVVCTTGEPLFAHQREIIAEAFGVPVANEFGSRDSGSIAQEAPNGQMLGSSESTLLEVLDATGQPVAPGELGEAVITGLCSDAQPFIRYRTGDMVRLSLDPGWEGRGLHVLAEVAGRTTDFIVRSDGAVTHALAIIYVFRAIAGIGEFKFIQHTVQHSEALVVAGHGWTDTVAQQLREGIRARLGADHVLDVKVVDHIPAEKSGKHRYVVSHVKLPETMATVSAGNATPRPVPADSLAPD